MMVSNRSLCCTLRDTILIFAELADCENPHTWAASSPRACLAGTGACTRARAGAATPAACPAQVAQITHRLDTSSAGTGGRP